MKDLPEYSQQSAALFEDGETQAQEYSQQYALPQYDKNQNGICEESTPAQEFSQTPHALPQNGENQSQEYSQQPSLPQHDEAQLVQTGGGEIQSQEKNVPLKISFKDRLKTKRGLHDQSKSETQGDVWKDTRNKTQDTISEEPSLPQEPQDDENQPQKYSQQTPLLLQHDEMLLAQDGEKQLQERLQRPLIPHFDETQSAQDGEAWTWPQHDETPLVRDGEKQLQEYSQQPELLLQDDENHSQQHSQQPPLPQDWEKRPLNYSQQASPRSFARHPHEQPKSMAHHYPPGLGPLPPPPGLPLPRGRPPSIAVPNFVPSYVRREPMQMNENGYHHGVSQQIVERLKTLNSAPALNSPQANYHPRPQIPMMRGRGQVPPAFHQHQHQHQHQPLMFQQHNATPVQSMHHGIPLLFPAAILKGKGMPPPPLGLAMPQQKRTGMNFFY
jgi:hypothetical protein